MKSKKTIPVSQVLEIAHKHLQRNDPYTNKDIKAGVCTLLEDILHETGNYKGFFPNNRKAETNKEAFYTRTYLS